jgi:hypothetical protein
MKASIQQQRNIIASNNKVKENLIASNNKVFADNKASVEYAYKQNLIKQLPSDVSLSGTFINSCSTFSSPSSGKLVATCRKTNGKYENSEILYRTCQTGSQGRHLVQNDNGKLKCQPGPNPPNFKPQTVQQVIPQTVQQVIPKVVQPVVIPKVIQQVIPPKQQQVVTKQVNNLFKKLF